jgi:hypothetical protein
VIGFLLHLRAVTADNAASRRAEIAMAGVVAGRGADNGRRSL